MSPATRPFNIMAKPVCGTCNLDCAYCYYTSKPKDLYEDVASFHMSLELLEAYTRQYLRAMPVQCDFNWQGGEPVLAGLDFYRRAVELQQQFKADEQTVSNAFQTNGTLLDDEWGEFLAESGFLVGVSIDGPAQWHDAFRRDHAGEPTFHRAWAGLELLRRHKVEFNILSTLHSANAPHAGDIYRYFTNRGIQYLQFIPIFECTPGGEPTSFSCTAEQFGRFYLDLFEQWVGRDVGKVSERLIDNVLHILVYGRASICCYDQRCANAHVLEFNGDLYACDHFVTQAWKLGNILETPLAELLAGERLEQFARLKTDLPAVCTDCEFMPFCRGGCPKHHVPIGADADRVNYFCEGYKMFFREALPELTRIAGYIKRGSLPPAGDAAEPEGAPASPAPQSQRQPRRKPKRNEPCPCGSGRKFKSCCGRA
ncbi:MAG: anaerobic sulfatase maturase [Planctomycetota bacterium]|jgi:uncharacterized protein